jgi:hypothetical protein
MRRGFGGPEIKISKDELKDIYAPTISKTDLGMIYIIGLEWIPVILTFISSCGAGTMPIL